MATDTDDGVMLPVLGENGTRSVQLPDGWLPSAVVRARRVGGSVVLEPVVPPSSVGGPGDVHGVVRTAWPPEYWQWLDAARERGEFGIGEIEPLDIRLQDPDDLE